MFVLKEKIIPAIFQFLASKQLLSPANKPFSSTTHYATYSLHQASFFPTMTSPSTFGADTCHLIM